MSALSNELFHGSPTAMKPGTTIKPGREGVAWASSNPDTAARFANKDFGSPKASSGKDIGWTQPAMFNPVYNVTPVNPKDVKTGYGNSDYSVSKSGFKVGKVHSWTSPKEIVPSTKAQNAAKLQQIKQTRKPGI